MSFARSLTLAAALAGAPSVLAQSVPAPGTQPLQTMPRPTPDADALAGAMRRLGANPRDLSALIEAGELSLRLGDVNAAATLFKRAEMVDPMNGRMKAGMARILVTQERPGEALRYFDQATGYGLDPRTFAGDRALAYDLIGEQDRAQRDYRVALKDGRNDEIERRYALSLAISGKREQALAEIDAQVRRNDRSAWRTRAFILAMTGDVPGAEKIAATMMPPGMGSALAPFFGRLPALTPIDRAFAVHFGELRASPQRLADARMAPPLPLLAPEAPAPVQVAAASPAPASRLDPRRERRRMRDEARRQRELAREQQQARRGRARETPPVVLASAPTDAAAGLQPPRYGGGVTYAPPRAVVQALPAPAPTQTPAPTPASVLARAETTPVSAIPPASQVAASINPGVTAAAVPPPGVPAPSSSMPPTQVAPVSPTANLASANSPVPQPGFSSLTPSPAPSSATLASNAPAPNGPRVAASVGPTVSRSAIAPPVTAAAQPVAPANAATPTVASATGTTSVPTPLPGPTTPASVVAATPVAPRMSEDTILARIMAGISIPAAELGVEPARARPTAPAPGTTVATPESIASAEAARRAAEIERNAQQARAAEAARKPAQVAAKSPASLAEPKAAKLSKAEALAAKAVTARTDRTKADTAKGNAAKADVAKADKEPPVDPKKAAADRKALAARKAADAKKVADAKKAADEAKLAKADPPRIWVQVAGGANESDLPKAWGSVKAKAPALKGKGAYSTPLRATNRVVTGPFKTDAEARAFVNTLAKQGVSAFPFTSEKGQKMKKLTDQ